MIVITGPYTLSNINAMSNDLVAGIIAPSGLAGLDHKIARDLAAAGSLLTTGGTGAIVHWHSVNAGHPKFPLSRDEFQEGKGAAAILDEITAQAKASLLVRLEVRDDTNPDEVTDERVAEAAVIVAQAIASGRLSGSSLHMSRDRHDKIETVTKVCRDINEVKAHFKALPKGRLLVDRSDLLKQLVAEGRDPLDALLDAIAIMPLNVETAGEDKTITYGRLTEGVIVPVAVGYVALEELKFRKTHRFPVGRYAHAYAESLTSLGEYRSIRSLAHHEGDPTKGALWRYESDPSQGLVYASASGSI
jgi:CRISPR type I-F-associated protein Csy2